jgi:hypothetical protein
MDQQDIVYRIFSLCLLVLAAGYFLLGGRIIRRQRPYLHRSSFIVWLLAIAGVPFWGAWIYMLLTSTAPRELVVYLFLSVLLIYALLAVIIRRQSREFIIVAVQEQALRSALLASLAQLGLTFEESILGFALPAIQDTLQVRVARGTAQLLMKSPGNFTTLHKIAQATDEHLLLDSQSVVLRDGWFYTLNGLFFVVLAIIIYV